MECTEYTLVPKDLDTLYMIKKLMFFKHLNFYIHLCAYNHGY